MKKYRESTYNQMQEAMSFLDSLPIDNPNNALWWCLHQIVWHLHLDRVMWILNNRDLITKIAQHKDLPPEDLMIEFRRSIQKLRPEL
jgi:hypothetical protein